MKKEDKIYHWTIYKIVSPSGRVYIGKTSNYKKRLSYYSCIKQNGQKLIKASLDKYGFDAHLFSIIEEFNGTNDYCDGKEMFWIRSYMTNNCRFKEQRGLNLTDGGQGTIGYKCSDEHRKKLSELHTKNPSRGRLGKKTSEEQKAKISATLKLKYSMGQMPIRPKKEKIQKEKKPRVAWNKGVPMSLEQIEYLRNINKGRPSKMKGVKFQGTEEERKIKFGAHNIGNSYNKGKKHDPELVKKRADNLRGKPNISLFKPIVQYSLEGVKIKEYKCIKDAVAETGIGWWTIRNIARGERKSKPDKFIFKFKKDIAA